MILTCTRHHRCKKNYNLNFFPRLTLFSKRTFLSEVFYDAYKIIE